MPAASTPLAYGPTGRSRVARHRLARAPALAARRGRRRQRHRARPRRPHDRLRPRPGGRVGELAREPARLRGRPPRHRHGPARLRRLADARRADLDLRATRGWSRRCSSSSAWTPRPSWATRWAASSARSSRSASRPASSASCWSAPPGLTIEYQRNEHVLGRAARAREPADRLRRRGSRPARTRCRGARARGACSWASWRPGPTCFPPPLVAEQIRGSGKPGFVDALDALTDYPIRDRLPEIACPTLIVWGEDDKLVPVRDADEFERLIPDARKVVFPDTGHVAMLERPRGVQRAARGLPGRGAGRGRGRAPSRGARALGGRGARGGRRAAAGVAAPPPARCSGAGRLGVAARQPGPARVGRHGTVTLARTGPRTLIPW